RERARGWQSGPWVKRQPPAIFSNVTSAPTTAVRRGSRTSRLDMPGNLSSSSRDSGPEARSVARDARAALASLAAGEPAPDQAEPDAAGHDRGGNAEQRKTEPCHVFHGFDRPPCA